MRPAATVLHEKMQIREVSYIDDMAIPIFSDAACATQKLGAACAIAFDLFSEYGLDLNFGIGKSEALIQWIGRGSASARRKLAVELNNIVPCQPRNAAEVNLRVVDVYKHLGTNVMVAGRISREIAFRVPCLQARETSCSRSIVYFFERTLPIIDMT